MLSYALLSFALAAVGGLILASFIFRKVLPPWALSLLHAVFGATGLGFLLVGLFQGESNNRVVAAFAILAVAALAGFYLAAQHFKGSIAQHKVVIIHAGLAVLGVLTLSSVVLL